jgi:ADP-ribose pyrophosphatase YjhB (NUDIX family)
MNYCSHCGASLSRRTPLGDDRPRYVCDACHTVHYENPKIVVGCIPEWEDHILLCRRAIEPRLGFWTVPAGYLEMGETLEEGARREALEEAGVRLEILNLYTLVELTHISQVYVVFRAQLLDTQFAPGTESSEVRLFREQDIPWDSMAFSSIKESLRLYFEDKPKGHFPFHRARIPPEK